MDLSASENFFDDPERKVLDKNLPFKSLSLWR
jgi:hypothetical protein